MPENLQQLITKYQTFYEVSPYNIVIEEGHGSPTATRHIRNCECLIAIDATWIGVQYVKSSPRGPALIFLIPGHIQRNQKLERSWE